MKFVLRDDDLSYYTNVEELDKLYAPVLDTGVKVSFACIPNVVKHFYPGDRAIMYQDDESQAKMISGNKGLVSWIMEYLKSQKVEVMLHGYTHMFFVKTQKGILSATKDTMDMIRGQSLSHQWLGEFSALTYEELTKRVSRGLGILENTFGCKVRCFVPPSNDINKDGMRSVVRGSLNLSGLIGVKYDREFTFIGLKSWLRRLKFAARKTGLTYPHVNNYGGHLELVGYTLSLSNEKKIMKQLSFCAKNNLPFQLATHYWQLTDSKDLVMSLHRILKEAKTLGYEFSTLSDVFSEGV